MRAGVRIIVGTIAGLVLGAVIASVALIGFQWSPVSGPFSVNRQTSMREVINSIETVKQVVLLRLGIQGISETKAHSKLFGVDIPGADRASFLQYTFTASLGVDGKDVKITKAGAKKYKMSIPSFVFIGHDDVQFKLVAEDNGVLSMVTPKVDTVQMINAILDDDAKAQYVEKHRGSLELQAKDFYQSIIRAVDPDAEVVFDFTH